MNPLKRNMWLNYISKQNMDINIFKLGAQSRLCANHFKASDYTSLKNNRLRKVAVPSIVNTIKSIIYYFV